MGKGMGVLPPKSDLGENEGMTLAGEEGFYGDDDEEHRMPS